MRDDIFHAFDVFDDGFSLVVCEGWEVCVFEDGLVGVKANGDGAVVAGFFDDVDVAMMNHVPTDDEINFIHFIGLLFL